MNLEFANFYEFRRSYACNNFRANFTFTKTTPVSGVGKIKFLKWELPATRELRGLPPRILPRPRRRREKFVSPSIIQIRLKPVDFPPRVRRDSAIFVES